MSARALAAVVLCCCGQAGTTKAPIVAEVNGVPLLLPDLERRMRADHLPARAALDRMIDEALEAELLRRSGGDLAWERKRALVQKLLAAAVEAPARADDVTEEDVQDLYGKARTLDAEHVLVKRPARQEDFGRARVLAERVRAAADRAADGAAFAAIAHDVAAPGLEVVHEDLGKFRRDGTFVPAFEEQVFRMRAPGEIAGPFETEFGWHVVRLREASNWFGGPLADVRSKVVEKVLINRRRQRLDELMRALARRAHVEVDATPLDGAALR